MTTLNFDNTQNAFAYKPNYELIRDYQIFRLINQGWLVKFGTRAASKMMDAGFKIPVAIGMRPTIYAVFCGGDTLPLATKKINQLYQYKVQSIFEFPTRFL